MMTDVIKLVSRRLIPPYYDAVSLQQARLIFNRLDILPFNTYMVFSSASTPPTFETDDENYRCAKYLLLFNIAKMKI